MKMNVVITGASTGIGLAMVKKFLKKGHTVFGIDMRPSEGEVSCENYYHCIADVRDFDGLPNIHDVNILINNAGTDCGRQEEVLTTNLIGTMNCTEKYFDSLSIVSILNIASTSAHNGAERDMYAASKGGVLAFTKNIAKKISRWGATCNSISPGGVITGMNADILHDEDKLRQVYAETMLGKWAEPKEVADLAYFLTVKNKSITAQDIIIDNGEMANFNFIL